MVKDCMFEAESKLRAFLDSLNCINNLENAPVKYSKRLNVIIELKGCD